MDINYALFFNELIVCINKMRILTSDVGATGMSSVWEGECLLSCRRAALTPTK